MKVYGNSIRCPLALLLLALFTWSCPADAAVFKGYLELDGIPGEARERGYEGWIEVSSFQQGIKSSAVTRGLSAAPGLRDRLRAWSSAVVLTSRDVGTSGGELTFSKMLDRASPKLYQACTSGKHINSAVLELVSEDQARGRFLRIVLKNVIVSSVSTSAADRDAPAEEVVSIGFAQIELIFIEFDVRAQPLLAHEFKWDFSTASGAGRVFPAGEMDADHPNPSALLGRNLLVNGDAEADAGGTDATAMVPPKGWNAVGNVTVLRYGAAGGFPEAGAGDGSQNFFAGGTDGAVNRASQEIDLSPAGPLIDAGGIKAVLSAWLGGYAAQEDQATLTARFFGVDRHELRTATLGPVTAAEREKRSELLFRTLDSSVPPGSRTVEVTLEMTRFSGPYNDGYADNLSLMLVEGVAGPPRLPVKVRQIRNPKEPNLGLIQFAWPSEIENVSIESVDSLGEPWQVEEPVVRVENGERVLDVPIDTAVPYRFWRMRLKPVTP